MIICRKVLYIYAIFIKPMTNPSLLGTYDWISFHAKSLYLNSSHAVNFLVSSLDLEKIRLVYHGPSPSVISPSVKSTDVSRSISLRRPEQTGAGPAPLRRPLSGNESVTPRRQHRFSLSINLWCPSSASPHGARQGGHLGTCGPRRRT